MSTSKTPSKSKNGAGAVVFFAAVAAVIFLCIKFVVPFAKYGIAKSLIQKEKYEQAVTMLSSLDGYRDSRALLTEVVFGNREYLEKGQIVQFGQWQGESVDWYIGSIENGRIQLISYHVLTRLERDGKEDSDYGRIARRWLNGEFYETAFTDEQKARIIDDNGYLYVLSQDEVEALPETWFLYNKDRSGNIYSLLSTGDWELNESIYLNIREVVDEDRNVLDRILGVRPAMWLEV